MILLVTLNIINVKLLRNLQLICSQAFYQSIEAIEEQATDERRRQKKIIEWQTTQSSTERSGEQNEENTYNEKLELKESFNGLKVLRHFLH